MSGDGQTPLALQMMTLSAIAYARENSGLERITETIRTDLAEQGLATGGVWTLVWGPEQIDETLLFCARDCANPGRFALVIRGTDPLDIVNWVQDAWIGLTPYRSPVPPAGGAVPRLTKGTALGLDYLVEMYRGVRPHLFHLFETRAKGQSLHDFLVETAVSAGGVKLFVTGHSMGGALAAALGVWLADWLTDLGVPMRVEVCTFAAPTPGDAVFAAYAVERIGDRHTRFANVHDIVPRAWNDLASLHEVPTRLTSKVIALVLDEVVRLTRDRGLAQVGAVVPLGDPATAPAGDWLALVGDQHESATYLRLLGAPLLPGKPA